MTVYIITRRDSQSKGSQAVVQKTLIILHAKKMANKQEINDCPPQDNPDNPDYVCTNCCTDTVELCDGCYERYLTMHSRENSQNDPDPPRRPPETPPVSPNLLNITPIFDNSENSPPSASGSGNQAIAKLVEISKTAINRYKYSFTYKDNTQIPTATITPNMTKEIEDPDNESITDDESKNNTTTNTSDDDSDTPIIDYSISNEEDPRVTSDEQHDSNDEEVVESTS